jgi:endonuclease-8
MIVGEMPEGDTIERIARRLQPLVGTVPAIATPHPRTAALHLGERLAGQSLQRVEARGKHLLLTFESGLVLHVHLRMTGRFKVAPADAPISGPAHTIWLEVAGGGIRGVLFNGPVLELLTPAQLALHPALRRLGGDVMDDGFDPAATVARFRRRDPSDAIGSALLDQRVLAGIGNVWRSEVLHAVGVAPARPLRSLDDATLQRIAATAAELLHGPRPGAVYGRTGRPCPRCGTPVTSGVVGDDGRRSYWCPGCQK